MSHSARVPYRAECGVLRVIVSDRMTENYVIGTSVSWRALTKNKKKMVKICWQLFRARALLMDVEIIVPIIAISFSVYAVLINDCNFCLLHGWIEGKVFLFFFFFVRTTHVRDALNLTGTQGSCYNDES